MEMHEARFPGRAPIEAYGDGGFRFAGMSHRGSVLLLPSGIYGWPFSRSGELTVAAFGRVFAEAEAVEFLLLGCGEETRLPPGPVRDEFSARGMTLEFMDTGAAARTYNVVLAEDRAVAAALIAIGTPPRP